MFGKTVFCCFCSQVKCCLGVFGYCSFGISRKSLLARSFKEAPKGSEDIYREIMYMRKKRRHRARSGAEKGRNIWNCCGLILLSWFLNISRKFLHSPLGTGRRLENNRKGSLLSLSQPRVVVVVLFRVFCVNILIS